MFLESPFDACKCLLLEFIHLISANYIPAVVYNFMNGLIQWQEFCLCNWKVEPEISLFRKKKSTSHTEVLEYMEHVKV